MAKVRTVKAKPQKRARLRAPTSRQQTIMVKKGVRTARTHMRTPNLVDLSMLLENNLARAKEDRQILIKQRAERAAVRFQDGVITTLRYVTKMVQPTKASRATRRREGLLMLPSGKLKRQRRGTCIC